MTRARSNHPIGLGQSMAHNRADSARNKSPNRSSGVFIDRYILCTPGWIDGPMDPKGRGRRVEDLSSYLHSFRAVHSDEEPNPVWDVRLETDQGGGVPGESECDKEVCDCGRCGPDHRIYDEQEDIGTDEEIRRSELPDVLLRGDIK